MECKVACEDLTTAMAKYEQEKMKNTTLLAEIDALKDEKRRTLDDFKTHENQIAFLTNEIQKLQDYCKGVEGDEEGVERLQRDRDRLANELKRMEADSEKRRDKFIRELEFEKEKAATILVHGIEERESLEKRWKKIWEDHSNALATQLATLKSNYASPLISSQEREEALKTELDGVNARYHKSKDAWEQYRKTLLDQLIEWKQRFNAKCDLLEEYRQGRMEVEIILQKKIVDLDMCQDMLNKGVDERFKLQRRLDTAQRQLKEVLSKTNLTDAPFPTNPSIENNIYLDNPILINQDKCCFTIAEFKMLQDKMTQNMQAQAQAQAQLAEPIREETLPYFPGHNKAPFPPKPVRDIRNRTHPHASPISSSKHHLEGFTLRIDHGREDPSSNTPPRRSRLTFPARGAPAAQRARNAPNAPIPRRFF